MSRASRERRAKRSSSSTKTYLVVYLVETDGEIAVERMSGDRIRSFMEDMYEGDYAIIDGEMVKDFPQKIDLTKL